MTVCLDFHYQFLYVDNFQGQRVETLLIEKTIRIKIVILDFSQAPKLSVKSKSLFIHKLDANTTQKSYLCNYLVFPSPKFCISRFYFVEK